MEITVSLKCEDGCAKNTIKVQYAGKEAGMTNVKEYRDGNANSHDHRNKVQQGKV